MKVYWRASGWIILPKDEQADRARHIYDSAEFSWRRLIWRIARFELSELD